MSYMSKFHQAIAYVYPAFHPDYYVENGNGFNAEVYVDYGFEREIHFKNLSSAIAWLDDTPHRLHSCMRRDV